MKKFIWNLVAVSLITFSCRTAADPRDIETADDVLASGWSDFENGSYQSSLDAFLQASATYSAFAYVGAGWASMRLGQYQDALSYLSRSDTTFLYTEDINDRAAGLVFLLWGADRGNEALAVANQLINREPNYVFQHDASVDFKDIAYVEACIYWSRQDWASCLIQIKKIEPSYTATLADPNISSILLTKLESLGAAQ